MMMDSEQPFGFTVRTDTDAPRPRVGPEPVADEGHQRLRWKVFLPHQCGAWEIAGGEWEGDGVPHADAVRDLTRFIAEARAALDLLIAGRETDR